MPVYEIEKEKYWFGPKADITRAAAGLVSTLLTAHLTAHYGITDLLLHAPGLSEYRYNTDPQWDLHMLVATAGTVLCWNLLKGMRSSARNYAHGKELEQLLGRELQASDFHKLYPRL